MLILDLLVFGGVIGVLLIIERLYRGRWYKLFTNPIKILLFLKRAVKKDPPSVINTTPLEEDMSVGFDGGTVTISVPQLSPTGPVIDPSTHVPYVTVEPSYLTSTHRSSHPVTFDEKGEYILSLDQDQFIISRKKTPSERRSTPGEDITVAIFSGKVTVDKLTLDVLTRALEPKRKKNKSKEEITLKQI